MMLESGTVEYHGLRQYITAVREGFGRGRFFDDFDRSSLSKMADFEGRIGRICVRITGPG